MFVGNPAIAPEDSGFEYARPDDPSDTGAPWRRRLCDYNGRPGGNPFGLLPAGRLYADETYSLLVERYGLAGFYILSAGWGILRADFLTPNYDITFGFHPGDHRHRRLKDHCWKDREMRPAETTGPVMFFGEKDYVPHFCRLTEGLVAPRIVWRCSTEPVEAPGCRVREYERRTGNKWHYECVRDFLAGKLNWRAASDTKSES